MTQEEKEAKIEEIKELFKKEGIDDFLHFEAPKLSKDELEKPIETVMKNMVSIATNLDILRRRDGILGKVILPAVLFTRMANEILLEEVVHPTTPSTQQDEGNDNDEDVN